MSHRYRRLDGWDVVVGLEGQRRYAWARYYQEQERAEQALTAVMVQRERTETLIPELLALVDAVLHRPAPVAFGRAYHVERIIVEYLNGQPIDRARRRRDYDD